MKVGENYELGLFKKQKRFTLEDVDANTDIEINVTFIDTQEELASAKLWLELGPKDIGVDIETRGLDPLQHEIIMLQFGDKYRQFVIDVRKVDVTNIIPLLINDQTTLIGQNLKFEYKFFKHNYNLELKKIKDTLIQEVCLHNGYNLKNDLLSLSKRYVNYEPDKSIRMRFLEIGDDDFNKDEIVYGAYDVVLPCLINEKQEEKLKERKQAGLLLLENEYLKVLGDMELKGMYFDKDKWYNLFLKNQILYNEAIVKLDSYIINDIELEKYISKQKDLFSNKLVTNIQWTSSKQVIGLFIDLGICPKAVSKTTKKLSYTVDAKILKAHINSLKNENHKQLIKDYLHTKELEQRVTTFGEKFFKYINPVTGRLHSSYRQIVSTGRSSSSGPNLQNIPSDKAYRKCFTAPEGYKIVNADFSGQENIVLANKSKDSDLKAFYDKGHSDMHSFIASKIYDKLYEDYVDAVKNKNEGKKPTDNEKVLLNERTIAKAAGFAIAYGGDGHTISKNLGIPQKQGDIVYNAYFKAFPGLRKYFDKVIQDTINRGYININDVTNRRLNLLEYKQMISYKKRADKQREYKILRNKIGRLALNAPVQGTAADITKNAAVRFSRWIKDNKLTDKIWITNIIHDEINVECIESEAQNVADNLSEQMGLAGDVWCKSIKLKASAQIGDYWAH